MTVEVTTESVPSPGSASKQEERGTRLAFGMYVLRRFGRALVVAFAVSFVAFILMRLIPGDPVRAMLGDGATEAAVAAFREKLGLSGSLWDQ